MVKKKQQEREGNGGTIEVSFRFPLKDWELFKFACEKRGKKDEEIVRELIVNWAVDVMKAELLPP
jgi:hypothetical protein